MTEDVCAADTNLLFKNILSNDMTPMTAYHIYLIHNNIIGVLVGKLFTDTCYATTYVIIELYTVPLVVLHVQA